MLSLLALALTTTDARAEAVIEFKTSGPVAILVDGQQATLMSAARQRATGLNAGVHQLEISGMFGKKLYEAEIDIPDNTITYVAWERGEIKVLKTEWLEDEAPAEEVAADKEDTGVAAEVPVESLAAAAPEVPAELPLAVPPVVPPAVDPLAVAVPPVVPPTEPVVPAAEAVALPSPKPRTLTVSASDGMSVEVVHNGHKVVIVVEGDTFKIQDANGMNVAYSAE